MHVTLIINGNPHTVDVAPAERLLRTLRRLGYTSVKHGCEDGTCGMCTVLVNGQPKLACMTLTAQADGMHITTAEGLAGPQQRGWKGSAPLDVLQKSFIETGAIQCGYCTPAMLLVSKALLERNPHPTEEEVRDVLSGVLCRCTGYVKPVQAVLRAAAILRGDPVPPIQGAPIPAPPDLFPTEQQEPPMEPTGSGGIATRITPLPTMVLAPIASRMHVVGKPEPKVDALKLVQGKPAFTDDITLPGMLYARLLTSPHPHARIKRIDVSKARQLPGVHAVLTYEDLPRVPFSTAGQSHPIPGPLDRVSLDHKVRFVGDRVAAVAAESPEIAERALSLIEVEYEELPPVFDPEKAMEAGAPVIHDQPDYVPFGECDPQHNVAAHIQFELGSVDKGFQEADRIFEGEYRIQKVQQASLEPHVCITWWDEDDRLVVRTATQVPFHTRRMLAPILGLPERRIRVIKPRIGGGFGGKQEMLIEDIAAHLTIVTGRPVRLEYTRKEEFTATSRHPMIVRVRTGVKQDGTIVANEMVVISDTGAYGNHAMTVPGNTLHKALALYNAPNIRGEATAVYTNTPPSGAYRGYGVPQGFFAMEIHMERMARALGLDPLEFRLKNALKEGDEHPVSKVWSEGREGHGEIIQTCGLEEAARRGAAAVRWYEKFGNERWQQVPGKPHLRRGIGVAYVMQGTAIAYLDMGSAIIKMNDDGSFNLLVGATDLGTGSDTVLSQMAAEVLGCKVEDIIIYSSDTDFTPFDKGAYASSTTYISGMAVVKAAQEAARQIREVAAEMFSEQGLSVQPEELVLEERAVWSPDGHSLSLQDIALYSLHTKNQRQIMGSGSHVSPVAPPPFGAQFAEVTVDVETGEVRVDRLLMAVDCGVIVNPLTASGQIEGGMTQALGMAVSEEIAFDDRGRVVNPSFQDYHVFRADEMPELEVIFVETHEPTGPFGVKAVAEIPKDGVAPAVANAVYDAVGVWITELPITPEKVWQALQAKRTAKQ